MNYYAVRVGRTPGIYRDWPACQAQVTGFKGAAYKKFATEEEARFFIDPGPQEWPKKRKPPRPKTGPAFDPTTALPGLTVFVDGSCTGMGTVKARAGIGVYFGPDDPRNLAEPLPLARYTQTNNAAELYAAVRALQITAGAPDPINVVSDSDYVVLGMSGRVAKWKLNGKWASPEKLPNLRLWHELDALAAAHAPGVKFLWVKGHASCKGNCAADKLAEKGRLRHLD